MTAYGGFHDKNYTKAAAGHSRLLQPRKESNQITTKKLVSLSEKELVDCATSEDHGCNGGLMDCAFEFILGNHGFSAKTYYLYEGVDGTYNTQKESSPILPRSYLTRMLQPSESALLKAMAK